MHGAEIGTRVGRLHAALVEGGWQDFAAMFVADGVYTHVTRGRELEAPSRVQGTAQIAEVAQAWLGLTTNRMPHSQGYYLHPDPPDKLADTPSAAYAVVANLTFTAVLANQPNVPVAVRVQIVLHLTSALQVAFMQTDQAIVRQA